MEKYYENDYVKIDFMPQTRTVFMEWKEFKTISFDDYKLAFTTAQDLLKAGKVENFISDNRKQGIINPVQRQWLEEESLPESVNIGMKRIAVVSDMNVFKRYYLNKLLVSINKYKIPFKIFKKTEKAVDWINSF